MLYREILLRLTEASHIANLPRILTLSRSEISWPSDMDPQLKDLLQNLLQRDPTKRLSWPELLYHPFIANGECISPVIVYTI